MVARGHNSGLLLFVHGLAPFREQVLKHIYGGFKPLPQRTLYAVLGHKELDDFTNEARAGIIPAQLVQAGTHLVEAFAVLEIMTPK